jgi:hypothetical protein
MGFRWAACAERACPAGATRPTASTSRTSARSSSRTSRSAATSRPPGRTTVVSTAALVRQRASPPHRSSWDPRPQRFSPVRSQVEHSKVRSSNPRSPGEIRAKAIRSLHTGHIGRSLMESMRRTSRRRLTSTSDWRPASIAIGTQESWTNWSSGPRENAGLLASPPSPHSPQGGAAPKSEVRWCVRVRGRIGDSWDGCGAS